MTEAKEEMAQPQEQTQEVQTETVKSHETDWKAEARKWEARAKENKSKADKLDEIEEASKTALEKAQERAEKAETKVKAFEKEAQRKQWIDEVSQKTGLPASVLRGDTREELESHAQVLQATFAKPTAPIIGGDGKFSTPKTAPKTNAEMFGEATKLVGDLLNGKQTLLKAKV